ncbi:hypothetical protein [Curtobacterium ammoniigenes]|uniref:hypothetical protein n=1 Tax=Curtobacterium ammoniigenes TaxID=395387 RepID=UPI00083545D5|nr:hypothetical protein [Curtobacterium ammoniigenes]
MTTNTTPADGDDRPTTLKPDMDARNDDDRAEQFAAAQQLLMAAFTDAMHGGSSLQDAVRAVQREATRALTIADAVAEGTGVTAVREDGVDAPSSASGAGPSGDAVHVAEEPRRMYVAHGKNEIPLSGFQIDRPFMLVPAWDHRNDASGWVLSGADLSMAEGAPFGDLWYRNTTTDHVQRVEVRWNSTDAQLEAVPLHPNDPEPDATLPADDAAALALDARTRAGTLLRLFAEIGSLAVPRQDTITDILRASGLDLTWTITHNGNPIPDSEPTP